jgi:hypothetical protein
MWWLQDQENTKLLLDINIHKTTTPESQQNFFMSLETPGIIIQFISLLQSKTPKHF